jgi:L-cysteine/cystine lyase
MPRPDKTKRIRQLFPVTQKKVYLNTGTCGPLSTLMRDNLNQHLEVDFNHGRASADGFVTLLASADSLRQQIATLTHATSEEIALTHHTTEGMNIVLFGLNWQAGDEIITTTVEHEGGLVPAYVLRQRFGVVIRMVDITAADTSDDDIIAKIAAQITPRTRLILFSHVAWNLGNRLPLERIVTLAQQHHILTLVDAAQSTGAIPLDLPASGVDFYAMPGQKWLCGPEGTGALYVRRDRLSLLNMSFSGFLSLKTPMDWDFTGHFMPAPGARRYEVGSLYRPAIHAMATHMAWLAEEVGWPWIYEQIGALNRYAYDKLGENTAVELITRAPAQSGILSFYLKGYDPARVVTKLAQQNIIIRFLGHPYCLRISTGFYNSKKDIDLLCLALTNISQQDPEALPPFLSPFS